MWVLKLGIKPKFSVLVVNQNHGVSNLQNTKLCLYDVTRGVARGHLDHSWILNLAPFLHDEQQTKYWRAAVKRSYRYALFKDLISNLKDSQI